MSQNCLPRNFHRTAALTVSTDSFPKTESRAHPLHPAGTGGKLTMILRFMEHLPPVLLI